MTFDDFRISRRHLLGGMATAAALPALAEAGPAESALRRLCRRMCVPEGAARLGARYGDGRDPAALEAELVRRLDPGGVPEAALEAVLRARIRGDFRDRDIVEVDGWRLSATEAHALALGASLAAA